MSVEKIEIKPIVSESDSSFSYIKLEVSGEKTEDYKTQILAATEELGLEPKKTLVRVINKFFLAGAEWNGTDRFGLNIEDERTSRADISDEEDLTGKDMSYFSTLKSRSQTLEDATYALPLDNTKMLDRVFSDGIVGLIPQVQAVVMYDLDCFDPIPYAGTNISGEYWALKPGKTFKEAIRLIVVQPPSKEELSFNSIKTLDDKYRFIINELENLETDSLWVIELYEILLEQQLRFLRKFNSFDESKYSTLKLQTDELRGKVYRLRSLISAV
ncbi:MAG: hypothetical protein ACRC80_06305, partial [Waterburya sp.]